MYEATNDTGLNYDTFTEMIKDHGWSAEQVLDYLIMWHGMDLLSKEFIQNLIDCEL